MMFLNGVQSIFHDSIKMFICFVLEEIHNYGWFEILGSVVLSDNIIRREESPIIAHYHIISALHNNALLRGTFFK